MWMMALGLALAGETQVWTGEVAVPRMPLGFTAHLEQASGSWTGTLDLPLQGAMGLELQDVKVDGRQIGFTLVPPGAPATSWAIFQATRSGNQASGTMAQSGQGFKFSMRLLADGEEPPAPRRPQTPVPPFPYPTEEVGFATPGDGITIACTLSLPDGAGPHPAALLITGSGPQDRDETLFGHKPFAVLADHLARNGIATLRCDDRGVGGTGGVLTVATSSDLAADARAGVAFLAARPEMDAARVGVIGHSEGANIGALAATESDQVHFVVLLAGTGLPGGDILVLQGEALYRAATTDEAKIAAAVAAHRASIAALGSPGEKEAALGLLRAQADLGMVSGDVDALATKMLESTGSPWFRSFIALDPRDALRRVKVPVLALNGSLDFQVPARANLPEIRKALAHNGDVTVGEVRGLNHLFQPAKTGMLDEYARIEQTMAPEVLEQVSGWIRARTGLD